jgi:gamma-glutamyl:cysteine ligase YbdK (ATP-grasp superfamily)
VLTVGVEEEFLLLHPDGAVAPVASDVVRLADVGDSITPEYMAYQLETNTPVCTRLADLRAELTELRVRAARGAERTGGVRLVATGAAPFAAGPLDALTDNVRYRQIAQRFPDATAAGGTCACQVHVGIPDRDLAVAVLARLRPWLPIPSTAALADLPPARAVAQCQTVRPGGAFTHPLWGGDGPGRGLLPRPAILPLSHRGGTRRRRLPDR